MDTPPRIGHPGRHHHPRQLQRGSQNPGAARKLRVAGWGGKHHAAGRNGGQLHVVGGGGETTFEWPVGAESRRKTSHVAERRKASCSCGWAGGGKFRVAGRGGKLRVAGRDGKRHVAGRAEENVEWLGGVAENFEWPVGKLCVAGAARELRVAGDGGNRMGAGRRKTSRRRRKGGSPEPIGHTASYVLISTLPRERAHLRSQRGRGRLQRAAPRARGSQHCNKRNTRAL